MVRIVAILKPYRLKDVLAQLRDREWVQHIHVQEVRGYGMQKEHLEDYSGDDVGMEFLPKIRLEILVDDLFAQLAMEAIATGGRTGRMGDGKIFLIRESVAL
ncbi:MAG: P-II family nitrogen regulator [Planctomycetota bacterium]